MSRRKVISAGAALAAGAAISAAAGGGDSGRKADMDRRAVILDRAKALEPFASQQMPAAGPAVMERAERIAAGTVFFYGTTPVEVGLKGIDWSGGHIAHQEWPAQLNRFGFLRDLAAAYGRTGDQSFARAARSYIEDWIDYGGGHEYVRGRRPNDSTLNMSIRMGTGVHSGWGATLPAFLASPSFDDDFLEKLFASLSSQGEYLSRHLTARANWRISELDALVFTALRFPFLANARELFDRGVTGMRNALATQFLPDGVHIERTPGYASWMTRVAVNYVVLPAIFPDADATVDSEIVARSCDYLAQARLSGLNDSTAPFEDPEELTELAERSGALLKFLPPAKVTDAPPTEQVFANAGQVFVRSAWKPGADYLAFDAGTWGGGHCHLSRLSFSLRSGGRLLLADPGIISYEMSNPLAPYGKSTPAHSTLNVGGLNQSEANADLVRTHFTADTALIHAQYQGGYWPGVFKWGWDGGRGKGTFGSHERVLFWVRGEYIIVLDTMATEQGETVYNNWQAAPMEKWAADADSLAWWSQNSGVNLLVQMVMAPARARMQVWEGSADPPRGWVGHNSMDGKPAPQLEFSYPALSSTGVTSAVLLAPFKGAVKPRYTVIDAPGGESSFLHHVTVGLPDGSSDHYGWSAGLALPIDDGRPLETDAAFVWYRADAAGNPVKCFLLEGGYLRVGGREVYGGVSRDARLVDLGA